MFSDWAMLEAKLRLVMLETLLGAEAALELALVPETWAKLEPELA